MSVKGRLSVIVAVDGPSGAGKSTVSRIVAERLGLTYIDTGAMYRAVALKSRNEGIDPGDAEALGKIAREASISFRRVKGENRTFLDGRDVSEEIRSPGISMLTSRISTVPEVRKALVELQRRMGEKGGIIMDGRDIGTVVFPDADFKFYLDASIEVRGKRRHLELKGDEAEGVERTVRELAERDRVDSHRKEAPLRRAEDAIYIDTSHLGIDEVVDRMVAEILAGAKCRGKGA